MNSVWKFRKNQKNRNSSVFFIFSDNAIQCVHNFAQSFVPKERTQVAWKPVVITTQVPKSPSNVKSAQDVSKIATQSVVNFLQKWTT